MRNLLGLPLTFWFEANPKIIDWLKQNGILVKKDQHKHSYPFGPRSKEKLIYRLNKYLWL